MVASTCTLKLPEPSVGAELAPFVMLLSFADSDPLTIGRRSPSVVSRTVYITNFGASVSPVLSVLASGSSAGGGGAESVASSDDLQE